MRTGEAVLVNRALRPDLREWVPEDDLVHFVIPAVEGLDLSAFQVNEKGSGSAQDPPHMMLSLLISRQQYPHSASITVSSRICHQAGAPRPPLLSRLVEQE